MNDRKSAVFLAVIAVALAMLACTALQATPTVSNIRMSTDSTGEVATSSYKPSDEFYVYADLKGLSAGQVVEARWYAVNAEGVDPNAELNTSDYKYETGTGHVYFQLKTSDGSDWPKGSYRVELYLDGTKVGEQGFTVQ